MPNTRICIDSSVFIPALQETDPDSQWLVNVVGPNLTVVIPRLLVQEVTRNLITPAQVQSFYRLLATSNFAFVVDEPIPRNLVEKYISLGLPEKGDAFIGAFVEWMDIPYLMWIPFETTTFREGIVTGTHESLPQLRNSNTLGLFWDLH